MASSLTRVDEIRGIRHRAVHAARLLLQRLVEFHHGGVRAQYVIWDRLCDFGDDQAIHARTTAGQVRS